MSGETRFRKRITEVDAVLHKGDIEATFEALREIGAMRLAGFVGLKSSAIQIERFNGTQLATAGDYIVVGNGDVWATSAGSFKAEFEPVQPEEATQ